MLVLTFAGKSSLPGRPLLDKVRSPLADLRHVTIDMRVSLLTPSRKAPRGIFTPGICPSLEVKCGGTQERVERLTGEVRLVLWGSIWPVGLDVGQVTSATICCTSSSYNPCSEGVEM